MHKKIFIYTDGGSRGNPGPAASGAVILDEHGNKLKEVSEYLGTQTNNYAEYQAVILGLQTAKKIFGGDKFKEGEMEVEVVMDSELVKRQLSGEYQIKEEKLFPQFMATWNLRVAIFRKIKFTHVLREKNKEADRMVNEALDAAARGASTLF